MVFSSFCLWMSESWRRCTTQGASVRQFLEMRSLHHCSPSSHCGARSSRLPRGTQLQTAAHLPGSPRARRHLGTALCPRAH